MGGELAAFVGAVALLGEVGGLQLSVCLDGDGLGGEDEVVALGAVVGSQVEVVLRAVFCADDGSCGEAVVVLGFQRVVCGLCLVDAEVAHDEYGQAFGVDFVDGCADTRCRRGGDAVFCGEAEVEDVEGVAVFPHLRPRAGAAFRHVLHHVACVELDGFVVEDVLCQLVGEHTRQARVYFGPYCELLRCSGSLQSQHVGLLVPEEIADVHLALRPLVFTVAVEFLLGVCGDIETADV